ncbi:hypothetical protein EDC01DRAFT_673787 [Geopyxis carbonaria]|nr:hypothetical protein EDC01DRAFT_673787 [Geopyxis carbonaria]
MAVRTSPAGHTFSALRALQFLLATAQLVLLSLTTIKINRVDPPRQPPPILYALTISALLFLYTAVTALLHATQRIHSWLNILALDVLATALLIPSAILLGLPLAAVGSCAAVGARNAHITTLASIVHSLGGADSRGAQRVPNAAALFADYATTADEAQRRAGEYTPWISHVGDTCAQLKGAWACAIITCILFAASAGAAWMCWRRGQALPEFEWDAREEGVVYIPETAGAGAGQSVLRGGYGGNSGFAGVGGVGEVEMRQDGAESRRSSEVSGLSGLNASWTAGSSGGLQGRQWPSEHV